MEIAVKQTGSLDETLVNDDLVRSPLGNWVCLHCRPNWLTLGHSVFRFFLQISFAFFCKCSTHSSSISDFMWFSSCAACVSSCCYVLGIHCFVAVCFHSWFPPINTVNGKIVKFSVDTDTFHRHKYGKVGGNKSRTIEQLLRIWNANGKVGRGLGLFAEHVVKTAMLWNTQLLDQLVSFHCGRKILLIHRPFQAQFFPKPPGSFSVNSPVMSIMSIHWNLLKLMSIKTHKWMYHTHHGYS